MEQFYRLAHAHGMPRHICGLARTTPPPFQKALMVTPLSGAEDAMRGKAPRLSRQCIIGWIGIVGLGCPSPDRLAKTPGWHCP
jgi:hypothetical protein